MYSTAAEKACILGTGPCGGGGATNPTPQEPDPEPQPTCAARWAQCGGQGWSGSTCCQSGSTCTASNEWYSQCV
jgi:hypothetical protein